MHMKVLYPTLSLAACFVSASALTTRDSLASLGYLVSRQILTKASVTSLAIVVRTFEDSIGDQGCDDVTCMCSITVAAALQACINCAIRANPTPFVVDSAKTLSSSGYHLFQPSSALVMFFLTGYSTLCAPFPNTPAVTVPAVPGASSSSVIRSVTSTSTTSSIEDGTFSILPIFPTTSGPQSTISQTVPFPSTLSQITVRPSDTESLSSSSSPSATADPGAPSSLGFKNGASNVLWVTIGAAIGVVLII
uniref:Uncharacterized protein n=1 Tax=Psilocybe cubensis TaxID=181762 RepID=A0A8H7XP50_PSICU